MHVLRKLFVVELKLLLREPAAWLLVLMLPLALVTMFGLTASPRTNTNPIVTYFPAMALSLGVAQLALTLLPGALATYRENGILRRMASTPVHPSRLLGAQLAVSLLMALTALAMVLVVGSFVLGFPLPKEPLGFALAFLLGTGALFAVGLCVAAVAPSGRVASGIGAGVFFLLIIFGGVFMPAEVTPKFMTTIGSYLPIGASMQAMRASWAGEWPDTLPLVAMAGLIVVFGAVAARTFRWE
ncbi:ABC transporter permease [Crossiella cryophila]|uniref:ABC-2 type transport system permease protein n=1 Tax=Crossiella cryophila TaxID=43355 RepID=A0A7W7FYE6_9PSEU|nr:ABC transporter permease [Crossiella cryophila]MBB4681593.1 ABC-2 type transport system permease protein [Crossiella cryophila]